MVYTVMDHPWNKEHLDHLASQEPLLERIAVDQEIMDGLPIVKGTRIPVYIILELLEAGYSQSRILSEYPALKEHDIKAVLRFASLVTSSL